MVLASLSGAMICRIGGATGASGPTEGWRRPALGGVRHSDQVGLWSLGGPSAEAVTRKLSLRRRRWSGGRGEPTAGDRAIIRLNGVFPVKIAIWLRVRLAQLDREASCWSLIT